MENAFRLKTTVAGHEFDAEGPVDVVNAAFQAFIQAVTTIPREAPPAPPAQQQPPSTPPNGEQRDTEATQQPRPIDAAQTDAGLTRIMRVDGRVVSLTARPRTVEDAALLLLYGQRALRENDSVTGAELIDGLTTTGGLAIGRVDRVMEKAARDGDAIVIGERRGKRYRLTNAGLTKARTVAADLIAIVA